MDINNVIRVGMRADEMMRSWLLMLRPMHKMSAKEMDIAVYILDLMKDRGTDSPVTAEDRRRIAADLKVSGSYLRVLFTRLRKAGFLLADDKVNKRFVPDGCDGAHFRFLIDFVIDGRRG